MKSPLTTSLVLNLVLLGGLVFLVADRRRAAEAVPASSEIKPPEPAAAEPPKVEVQPFRWNQLFPQNNYRALVANLRAIGCPDATIDDIVRGDAERAFAFERRQLALEGSGSGPWSQASEDKLVTSLLGESSTPAAPAQDSTGSAGGNRPAGMNDAAAQSSPDPTQPAGGLAMTGSPAQSADAPPVYPLFLQNVRWSDLGFSADQQAAIGQARQQFLDELNGANQDSGQPAQSGSTAGAASAASPAQRLQAAVQDANDTLRGLLGADGYNAYEMQQYMNWFQPQVTANVSGGPLFINLNAFSSQ